VNVAAKDSAKTIAANINAVSAQTGVQATAKTEVSMDVTAGGTSKQMSFTLNGTSINVGDGVNIVTLDNIASAINNASSTTGVAANRKADGTYTLTAADGSDIKFSTITQDATTVINVGGQVATTGIVVGGQVSFSS